MASDNRIDFKVGISDDGLPGLKKLIGGLDEAGVEAGVLSQQAGAALAQLKGVGDQQQAVETLRNLASQGRELGGRLNSATTEVDRLGAALQAAKDQFAQTDGATKEAAGQIKVLEREYNAAVAAAKRASSAVGENQRAMDAAKKSARDLGVDTGRLIEEKRRLEQAAQDARKGLDGVAASIERVRQRQIEASNVLKSFQADLKKLDLEGPQAPAGLEQAFRKLGLDGVRKAESAVHELQVALAQIRNSPDILPADKAAAVTAFKQRVAELRAETGKAATSARDLSTETDRAGTAFGAAAGKAVAFTGALVGLSQLKSLAADVLETGSQFENLEVRLGNLLGSTEAAAQAMEMIKGLAATTPFEVSALAESFVKLTAFGMQPTEAQMRSLSDVAANLGGGTEVLTGVTLALGQAWVKGKLQGEEIMQLAERGVPVWDALAKATGRTVPELQKMSEAGALGRDVISSLIDQLGRMNAGASDELMRTYAGAVSNAKDALAEFFDMIAKAGVLDWLTEKMRELLAEFERMKETGELQERAREVSEAFISVAQTAEAVTRTLIDMAPVIEVAVKAWLAFKAVNIAASLYSIAAGAAVAAPAMTATAVGARSAAAGMTVAATAATALSIAIKRLLAATGLGLVLVAIGEIGLRLFGVGESAKKAGDDLDTAFAPRAQNGPSDAAQEAESRLVQLAGSARAAADGMGEMGAKGAISGEAMKRAFDDAIKSGKATDVALREIGKDFDLGSVPGIQNAAVVLDGLLNEGKITAEQFRAAWDGALKGIDLSQFELQARVALENTWQGVGRLGDALDAGLREAIRRSGADFELLSGGMGKAAKSALEDSDLIIGNLDALRAKGVDTGKALEASLSKAIDTADGQKAVDELRSRIESMRKELGEKVTDGLLSDLQQQAEKLGATFEKLPAKVKTVAERTSQAFKDMGIQTKGELEKTAQDFGRNYELIKASGQATAQGLSAAFKKYAEASIDANDGVASEAIQAEAAMRGLRIEVDETGRAIVKSMEDGKAAVEGFAKGVQEAQDQLKRLAEIQGLAGAGGDLSEVSTDELKKAQADLLKQGKSMMGPEYIKLRNELMGRKAPTTDQEGFTLDKSGNRLTMGGDLNTLTGIANFLKGAGLNEEQARSLAREFSDAQGNVPYFSNPGQMKYGGAGSTMSQALLKAAERITFGTGGANGAAAVGEPTGGGTTRHEVVVKMGARTRGFNAASSEDASVATSLFKELAVAAGRR